MLSFPRKWAPSALPVLSQMKSLSSAFLTWSAADTLAKEPRLLEVKEEKVVRREEYPQNGILGSWTM